MRSFLLFLILLIAVGAFCFSQSNNYANGNGTIIEVKTDGNVKWIFRKHIQSVKIGDLAKNDDLNIYDKPALENPKIIGRIKLNDVIKITQVAEAVVSDQYYYWVNFSMNKISGWIFCGKWDNNSIRSASSRVPYYDNRYEIIETIKIRDKSWTIRKVIPQQVSLWQTINMYDKPGLIDTQVVSTVVAPINMDSILYLTVTEMTEEKETIDGKTEEWIKVNYNGVSGWVFAGYVTVERGGWKIYTPEHIIDWKLGWS